ncbi:hypothetical protein ACFVFF_38880 [Streptomyces sp. NPDC057680]|uniref:hypothetical protein n=1 Tax=Streptomyces sp. NPDC057680 TaxID=3346208 RepID=UPI00368692B6
MDTSELYRSLGLNPGQLNALVRDMDHMNNLMRDLPSSGLLDSVHAMTRDVGSLTATVSSVMDQLRAEGMIAHSVAQQSVAALEAAGVSTAIADTLDLSWLQGSLSQIADSVAQQSWFAQRVQELYASDLLDHLADEGTAGQVEEVSDEMAAALAASALAFQEQVTWLPFAEQKRLFIAFMVLVVMSLLCVAAVSLDGPGAEVLANASGILGVAGTTATGAARVSPSAQPRG